VDELEVELVEEDVDEPGVGVGVGDGVAVGAVHVCFLTVVLLNVTAPVLARSLPFTVEPPSSVIVADARIFPTNVVDFPRVTEEPTFQ
jgi:hypothetical protein